MLAAKAYGYETNLLDFDLRSGEQLISQIVRERSLGRLYRQGAETWPMSGPGLAGILATLNENFQSLKGPLGLNNPTRDTYSFSLRHDLARIVLDNEDVNNDLWYQTLDGIHNSDSIPYSF